MSRNTKKENKVGNSLKGMGVKERGKTIDEIAGQFASGMLADDGTLLDSVNTWAQECERFVNQTQPLVEMNLTAILNAVHTTHGKIIVVNYTKACKFDCVTEKDDGYHMDVNKLTAAEYETLVALNNAVVDFVKNGTN